MLPTCCAPQRIQKRVDGASSCPQLTQVIFESSEWFLRNRVHEEAYAHGLEDCNTTRRTLKLIADTLGVRVNEKDFEC
jgi:hypothetical protein